MDIDDVKQRGSFPSHPASNAIAEPPVTRVATSSTLRRAHWHPPTSVAKRLPGVSAAVSPTIAAKQRVAPAQQVCRTLADERSACKPPGLVEDYLEYFGVVDAPQGTRDERIVRGREVLRGLDVHVIEPEDGRSVDVVLRGSLDQVKEHYGVGATATAPDRAA